MLLKRAASRGGGGAGATGGGSALGSLHPMALARHPSKFLPVIAVVVVMFFIAVYR
jgi:preprotein translocase subunit SecG